MIPRSFPLHLATPECLIFLPIIRSSWWLSSSVWRPKHKHGYCLCRQARPRHLSNIVAHWAAWSPDGRQLAFAKGSDIFLANADGTNARKLITVSGRPVEDSFFPGRHSPSVHARNSSDQLLFDLGSPCRWQRSSRAAPRLAQPALRVLRCLECGWPLLFFRRRQYRWFQYLGSAGICGPFSQSALTALPVDKWPYVAWSPGTKSRW